MSLWGSAKPRRVLAALLRIGWTIKRESHGSHRILSRPGWPDLVFAFHDRGGDQTENARSYWEENRFNAERPVALRHDFDVRCWAFGVL